MSFMEYDSYIALRQSLLPFKHEEKHVYWWVRFIRILKGIVMRGDIKKPLPLPNYDQIWKLEKECGLELSDFVDNPGYIKQSVSSLAYTSNLAPNIKTELVRKP